MSIPGLIYFAMGAIVARILLDGTQTRGYQLMDWFRLVFDVSRIVILWPLILFVEKIAEWLKQEPQVAVQPVTDERTGDVFGKHRQFEKPVPITGSVAYFPNGELFPQPGKIYQE